MNALLFLIIGFLVQETVITDAAIFQARQAGIDWVDIHILWTVITIIHLVVPYYLTRLFLRKISKSTMGNLLNYWGVKIHKFLIKWGEIWGLLLLGVINFVYLNSILGAWLKIDFKKAFVLFFIGDLIWYLWVLGVNIGVRSLIPDTRLAFIVLIVVAFIVSTSFKIIFKRVLK